jgi:hypothetical protein
LNRAERIEKKKDEKVRRKTKATLDVELVAAVIDLENIEKL